MLRHAALIADEMSGAVTAVPKEHLVRVRASGQNLCLAAMASMALACGSEPRRSVESDSTTVVTLSPAEAALDTAARRMVAFLRGEVPPDSVFLADTVDLVLAWEGGGTRALRSRTSLAEPRDWVLSTGSARYSFVPPGSFTTAATRVGRHLNCREADLATRAPGLASRPHVGVMLSPPNATSCLQSWVVTFVFDTAARARPRLVAAVYDQWEW